MRNPLPALALDRELAQAIGQAVEQGELHGQRLPTHRALADRLGVTVGTITRAYSEAEHQGWVTARVGAGTYVREETGEPALNWHIRQPDPSRIELWQNLPIPADRKMHSGMPWSNCWQHPAASMH